MARKSNIWWRASRQAWFTKYQGRQIMLGTTREAADAALRDLFCAPKKSAAAVRTVRELLEAWLIAKEASVTPQTALIYRYTVRWFVAWVEGLKPSERPLAADVRPGHITAWLATRDWGKSSRAVYGGNIRAAFQWGADQTLIPEFHLGRLRLGTTERRRPVTEADAAKFRAAIQDAAILTWFDISVACGARPGELIGYRDQLPGLQAKDLAPDFSSAIVTGKTGQRTIYFPRHVRSLLAELSRLHPTGPLLRNRHGSRWRRDVLDKLFQAVSERAGVSLVPYHTRHLFATRSLRANGEIITAALTGHRNLSVLHKHYVALESGDLDEAVDRVKAG